MADSRMIAMLVLGGIALSILSCALGAYISRRSTRRSSREAVIEELVKSLRFVNVTPENEREIRPEPAPSASLPAVRKLQGPLVEYCANECDAAVAVERLRSAGLLAIDIETTPKSIAPSECSSWSPKMRALHPKSADIRLIQVYDGGDSVHVFDLKRGVNLNTLYPLFERPLIAHNASFERRFLAHRDIHPLDLRCTMQMARRINPDAQSLERAAEYFLSARLDKRFQKTDWSIPELSNAQIKYAARDAWVCFLLYQQISNRRQYVAQGCSSEDLGYKVLACLTGSVDEYLLRARPMYTRSAESSWFQL